MRDTDSSTLASLQYRISIDSARNLAARPIDDLFLTLAHKRSGHHAIIDWILSQFIGIRAHHNFANKRASGGILDCCDSHWASVPNGEASGKLRAVTINLENSLVATPEDLDLLVRRCTEAFPCVSRLWVLIVVRDSYNNFASCYQRVVVGVKPVSSWRTEIWENHAELFLRAQDISQRGIVAVPIAFNQWFSDLETRQAIATALSVDTFVPALQRVSHFGSGSSFDGFSFDHRASDMRVLERWKCLCGESRVALRDAMTSKTHDLNRAIFGGDLIEHILRSLYTD
jgi:hypothetical protein